MTVRESYKKNTKLTAQQKKRIDDAARKAPAPDADSPEYSYEELKKMYSHARSVEKRQKDTVSLRLDAETLALAKAFGKGYTAIMGVVLYKAYRDPAFMERVLAEYEK